eukprot:187493-Amphidinium_carterae.1
MHCGRPLRQAHCCHAYQHLLQASGEQDGHQHCILMESFLKVSAYANATLLNRRPAQLALLPLGLAYRLSAENHSA